MCDFLFFSIRCQVRELASALKPGQLVHGIRGSVR